MAMPSVAHLKLSRPAPSTPQTVLGKRLRARLRM